VLLKRSAENIETPAEGDPALAELGAVITNARAEMQRLVQLGELQGDPLRHPIEALSVHLGALQQFAVTSSQVATGGAQNASLTAKQIDDIGRQLMGGCQGWTHSFVRASFWRGQAILAIVVLGAVAIGFGSGWWAHSLPAGLTCADQADGSRVCWMYTRLPPHR
jgi:hypothetical protein